LMDCNKHRLDIEESFWNNCPALAHHAAFSEFWRLLSDKVMSPCSSWLWWLCSSSCCPVCWLSELSHLRLGVHYVHCIFSGQLKHPFHFLSPLLMSPMLLIGWSQALTSCYPLDNKDFLKTSVLKCCFSSVFNFNFIKKIFLLVYNSCTGCLVVTFPYMHTVYPVLFYPFFSLFPIPSF
jgi:hypothetical protein